MSDVLSSLTQDELLLLALEARRSADPGRVLAYLKEAAARDDVLPQTLFMLGSEYAQLGLSAEAKMAMTRAVEEGPDFHLARFQLGMLHLTSGEIDAAEAAWEPLAALDARHPQAYLASFRLGMLHLVADQFDDALQALREGVAMNQENPPLSGDIRKVVDAIEHLPGRGAGRVATSEAAPATGLEHRGGESEITSAPSVQAEVEPGHFFISAYTQGGKLH